MDIVRAIVLGIAQGLTEFLPISSSGHLILVPWLFGWDQSGLEFDAALHLGTLAAVFAYFRRDIVNMLQAIPVALRSPLQTLWYRTETTENEHSDDRHVYAKLGLLIVFASVPGGIAGLLAAGSIDDMFHDPDNIQRAVVIIAIMLALFALVLWLAEGRSSRSRRLSVLSLRDALIIGAAQALALLPGVSRSGVTLSAGLFRGLHRADAARFSFLLGIPLITLAGLAGVVDIVRTSPDSRDIMVLLAGLISAALSGLAAIWGLLRFLQHSSTMVFIVYRLVVATSVILLVVSGIR
ncbi:undecaprenyl-diphosphate phosphatase [soil metagenome]